MRTLAPLLLFVAACGDPAVGSTPDGGTSDTTATDAAAGDAAGDGGADTPAPKLPICQQACAAPGDCSAAPTGAFDASHYACDAGTCRYKGCTSDSECTASFGGTKPYKCHPVYGVPSCVAACSKPSDCATTSTLYDADNYACTDGACEWTGCNDDAECKDTLKRSNTTCRAIAGGLRNCLTTCTTASDCSVGGGAAFDADNYTCDGGVCMYRGCKTDAECVDSFKKSGYVCR